MCGGKKEKSRHVDDDVRVLGAWLCRKKTQVKF